MNTKKILMITGRIGGGGAEAQLVFLAHILEKNNVKTYIMKSISNGSFEQDLPESTEMIKIIPPFRGQFLFNFPLIIFYILKIRPKAIYSNLWGTSWQMLIIEFLLKRILKMKDISFIYGVQNDPDALTGKLRLKRYLFRKCDAKIIPCSNAIFSKLNKKYNVLTKRMLTVYNVIDASHVIEKSKQKTKKITKNNNIKIIHLASFKEQKRHDLVLETISKLKNNFEIHFLGRGVLYDKILSYSKQLNVFDRAIFHGYQDNPYSFFPFVDAMIVLSDYEGLSIAVLEAMSFGLPVIARKISGMEEIIENGEDGILIDSDDPGVIAIEIEKLFRTTNLEQISINAKKKIKEKFSVEAVGKKYIQFFDTILQ